MSFSIIVAFVYLMLNNCRGYCKY